MEQMFKGVKEFLENVLKGIKNKKLIGLKEKINLKRLIYWKKPLLISSMIMTIAIVSYFVYQSGFYYQVKLNGVEIGFVKEVFMVESSITEVEKNITGQYGDNAHFEKEISFERVRVNKDLLIDQKQLEEIISQEAEIVRPAAIIMVEGQKNLVVDSTQNAQEILDEVKKPFINKDRQEKDKKESKVELLEVSFSPEVEIISQDVAIAEILTKEQAMNEVVKNTEQMQTYKVAKGDSAWNISRAFNMGIRTLEEANPGKDIEKLKPGEDLNLYVPKPYIDVVTIEKHVKTEAIKFKVEEKKDSSLYTGQKKISKEGKNGKKEVTMKITFVNGLNEKKEILNEKILERPKTQLVLVGTKARPKSSTTSSRGPAPTYKGDIGSAIVRTASNYIGVPYRHGGSTPSGFDCSGLTSYVYRQYGIILPRSSGAQASLGGYVSRSDLKPGDLVIFPGHVGIYAGGNRFIHAPRTGKRVEISSLNGYWSSRFRGGRRIY